MMYGLIIRINERCCLCNKRSHGNMGSYGVVFHCTGKSYLLCDKWTLQSICSIYFSRGLSIKEREWLRTTPPSAFNNRAPPWKLMPKVLHHSCLFFYKVLQALVCEVRDEWKASSWPRWAVSTILESRTTWLAHVCLHERSLKSRNDGLVLVAVGAQPFTRTIGMGRICLLVGVGGQYT